MQHHCSSQPLTVNVAVPYDVIVTGKRRHFFSVGESNCGAVDKILRQHRHHRFSYAVTRVPAVNRTKQNRADDDRSVCVFYSTHPLGVDRINSDEQFFLDV